MNRRNFLKFLGMGIVSVGVTGITGLTEIIEQKNESVPVWQNSVKRMSLSITDGKTTIPLEQYAMVLGVNFENCVKPEDFRFRRA